jgi:phospholipid/cholesterol/gamma-HCH transport system substrate-binding protein
LALGIFVASIWVTWVFLTGGFRSGPRVEAVFGPPGIGQQLPVGGDIKVRGVLVGRITDLRLDGGDSVVEFSLNGDEDIPADVTAEVRSKTIFGEKWVELVTGSSGGPYLADGDVIPDERTVEPLELERALQLGHDLLSEIPLEDLRILLASLADGFSGHEEAAGQAIDRGVVALRAVNSRAEELDESLRQLAEFSAWLDDNDQDLLSFMSSLDAANRALVGAAPEFESSMDSVPVFLDEFASFQEATERDFGRLVEQGATVAEVVAERADNLTDIVVQLQAFTTVWNSGLSQPCGGEFETGLTCWQVYQVPGLDSRGLYSGGGGPHRDEAGDPGGTTGFSLSPALVRELNKLLSAAGDDAAAADLARLLLAPVLTDPLLEGSVR